MFKYIFFLIIIFSSCSSLSPNNNALNNNVNEFESVSENPFFFMKRTPCFGKCPTYNISFFEDGKVIYEGKKFVQNEGFYVGQLNIKTVALIQDKIRSIDFFNLDSMYDARISDLPSVILEVNMDGKSYKIIDRYKGPEELRKFEKFIDDIILKMENGLIGDYWEKVIK